MNEIDRLYQLPLGAFTPARNALAKQSKADRALVAKLQKPNVPAWAVNQIYWHHRPVYEALIKASERVRAAQAAMMKGQRADLAAAESAHGAALKSAMQQIRQVLKDAGEASTPATMTAVSETLQALPSTEPAGRLTRPLRPLGFEALTRLLAPGGVKTPGTILPFTSKPAAGRDRAEAKRAAEAARREAEAQAREIKKLEAAVREARGVERAAETAAAKACTAAATAAREHLELTRRVDAAADEADRLKKEAAVKDRAATEASVTRQRIEARLKALTP